MHDPRMCDEVRMPPHNVNEDPIRALSAKLINDNVICAYDNKKW